MVPVAPSRSAPDPAPPGPALPGPERIPRWRRQCPGGLPHSHGRPSPGPAEPPDTFLVPSPQEPSVAVELYAVGIPLSAISDHLRELRGQVEHIASRFLEFTTEYDFARHLADPGHRTDVHAAEAAAPVRRLRPLAQRTVNAELALAMGALATRQLRTHLVTRQSPNRPSAPVPCHCPPTRSTPWKS